MDWLRHFEVRYHRDVFTGHDGLELYCKTCLTVGPDLWEQPTLLEFVKAARKHHQAHGYGTPME